MFEDEVPYKIPESWQWVRLHQIGEIVGGGTPKTNNQKCWNNGNIPWITPADMREKTVGKYISRGSRDITIYGLQKSSAQLLPENSLVFSSRAPIGYIAIAKNPISTNQGFKSVVPYVFDVVDFLYYCIQARLRDIEGRASGTTFKEISGANFGLTIIPIPPIEEQKRIVEKIEGLLPLVERYGEAEKHLLELNKKFPDDLRKAILQQAVQGKLTEQDPDDEPASELIKRIKAEKDRLIKEGKNKRQKSLAPISENELPFDIPENWAWARISEICELNPRNQIPDDAEVSFIPMQFIEAGFLNQFRQDISQWGKVKNGYTHLKDGDVVFAKITPCFQNRKSAILTGLKNGYGAGTTELHVLRSFSTDISTQYLLWFVKNGLFIHDGIKNFTGTVGQQRVSTVYISQYLIPIPPFSEQQRIVKKIEELFVVSDKLE